MRAKKCVYFFSVLLLFSGLMFSVRASSTPTMKFDSNGVTIVLTYPEEAHPDSVISHNVTITANTDLDSVSVSLYIYAPVNSTLQHIKNQTLSWSSLPENQSLPTSEIQFTPQQANGTLYCNMTVQTEIVSTMYYASYSFYTTRVSELTFSEMQFLYYEMLTNYTSLQAEYETRLDEYDSLLANYSSLLANYTALLSEHNQLIATYNSKVSTYESLLAQYNKLSDDYENLNANYRSKINELSALQADYGDLNSTRNSIQTSYNTLQAIYDGLNQTYTDLQTEFTTLQQRINDSVGELNIDRIIMFIFTVAVAALIGFIIYLKRKKEEPYLVIRKETVSMKSDEEES